MNNFSISNQQPRFPTGPSNSATQNNINNTSNDTSAVVEQFLSKLLETLDQPISNPQDMLKILPQLHPNPRIIINGNPFGSREQFQQLWATLPLSSHQVTSCDVHLIPSANNNTPANYVVLAHLRVKFDESGKNKMGETALFNNNTNTSSMRAIWSHWFGVSLSFVVDSSIINNFNTEAISTWDYRFTESPTSSIFKLT